VSVSPVRASVDELVSSERQNEVVFVTDLDGLGGGDESFGGVTPPPAPVLAVLVGAGVLPPNRTDPV
jgi:hypothetical protein